MARLLIVEDNEMNRTMLTRRLHRLGFEILNAANGREAIATASVGQPDLILMDLSLPIVDGWTATRLLKSNPKTHHIPVVALTAHAMTQDRDGALAAGCDEYETKPIDLPRLLEKIRLLLPGTETP